MSPFAQGPASSFPSGVSLLPPACKSCQARAGDLTWARVSAQVDMFSYGMVLYELLSGQRPALGHHQLQIAKKLSKGIRPMLGQPEEVQFHRLQALMMECWDTQPEKVPWRAEGLEHARPATHSPTRRFSNTQGEPSLPAASRKRCPRLLIHLNHFLWHMYHPRENGLFFPPRPWGWVITCSVTSPSYQPCARTERTSVSLCRERAGRFAHGRRSSRYCFIYLFLIF